MISKKKTKGVVLHGANMTGLNLKGKDFQYCEMNGAILRSAAISRADFSGCQMQGCDLRVGLAFGVDFHEANLRGANFEGATLKCCSLEYANLSKANLEHCCFHSCHVINTSFDGAKLNFRNHEMMSAVLTANVNCDGKALDHAIYRKRYEFASSIVIRHGWCWDEFIEGTSLAIKKWAARVLKPHVEIATKDRVPRELEEELCRLKIWTRPEGDE